MMSEKKPYHWSVGIFGEGGLFFALLIVFAIISIPSFTKTRHHVSAKACANNLRQIDIAARQFALGAQPDERFTDRFSKRHHSIHQA
jgi:hypothetical protein